MKKKSKPDMDDEMRPEYNLDELGEGVRGKYAKRYREGTNVVLLDPDVAKSFPDSKTVNEALRLLMKITQDVRDYAAGLEIVDLDTAIEHGLEEKAKKFVESGGRFISEYRRARV